MWTHRDGERGDRLGQGRDYDASPAGPERLRLDVWLLALEPPETLVRVGAEQRTEIVDPAARQRGWRRFSRRDGSRSTPTARARDAGAARGGAAAPRDSGA